MKKILICIAVVGIFLLPAVSLATFNQNLSYGTSNSAVTDLQNFLNKQGFYNGPITGNFFGLTKNALINFQKQNGIQPASGFFGTLTRTLANKLLDKDTTVSANAANESAVSQTNNNPSANQSSAPSLNTVLCNGTYVRNVCPAGQNFVCPDGGSPYCEVVKTDQQKCIDSYGSNSVYTGNKNTSGGPICGCASGYEWNSNQTTCQIQQQTIQQPTTITVQPNTTQCNGTTYTTVCPAGLHFFCATNGEGGKCVPENANYCNGTAWNTCPSGESFSCSTTGGACSPPPATYQPSQTVTPPPASQGPSLAQQAACQQAYDQGVAAYQLSYQSQVSQVEAKYEQDLANMRNQEGASGMQGGYWNAQEQGLAATRDRTFLSLTADYNVNISNEKMALTKCLNP